MLIYVLVCMQQDRVMDLGQLFAHIYCHDAEF